MLRLFGKNRDTADEKILAALGRVRIFENLAMADVENLARQIDVRNYSPESAICVEGDEGDGMYVISEGEVEVFLKPKDQPKKVLSVLRDGDFFGEMALINEENIRTASVSAIVPTTCLFLSKSQFEALLGSSHATAAKILFKLCRVLSDRLSETSLLAAGGKSKTRRRAIAPESAPAFAPPPLPGKK